MIHVHVISPCYMFRYMRSLTSSCSTTQCIIIIINRNLVFNLMQSCVDLYMYILHEVLIDTQ